MHQRKMSSDPGRWRLARQKRTINQSLLESGSASQSLASQQVLTVVFYQASGLGGARNGERSGSGSGIAAMSILA